MTEDEQILDAIRNGKNQWVLNTLYKRSLPKVKRLIRKMNGTEEDALDIFQEAAIILFRQVMEGKTYEGTNIDGYLHRVCRNLYLNELRKKNKNISWENWEALDEATEPAIERHLALKSSENQVLSILDMLGTNCKDLLSALVMDELDYKEAAQKLGYANTDVLKAQKYRCKKKMEELLAQRPELLPLLGVQ